MEKKETSSTAMRSPFPSREGLKNYDECFGSSVSPSVSLRGKSALSFREAIEEAEAQIEPETFESSLRGRVREVCRVIAEIYMLPDGSRVKIEGEELPIETVREVFAQLNDQHVRYSFERLDGYEGRIFAMKAFLRTLLYNSVFEMESHYDNRFRADRAEGKI